MKKTIALIFLLALFNNARSQWNNETIVPTGTPTQPLAKTPILAWPGGPSDQIFFIGNDNKIRNYYKDASNVWQEAALNPTVQATSAYTDLVGDPASNVYYIGSNGYIYKCSPASGIWPTTIINTFTVSGTGTFTPANSNSRLAITIPSSGQVKLFYVATDNKVHYIHFNGSGWSTNILYNSSTSVRGNSALRTDAAGDVYYFGLSDSKIRKQNSSSDGLLVSSGSTAARGYSDILIDNSNGKTFYIGTDSKIRMCQSGTETLIFPSGSSAVSLASNIAYTNGNVIYCTSTTIYTINVSSYGQVGTTVGAHSGAMWHTLYSGNTYGATYYFDNTGKLHKLNPILSATNLTSSPKLYEKFEIGVALPTDIQTKVNSFLSTFSSTDINPYDPDQIQIKTTFTDPSNNLFIRYGFYYRDVAPPTTSYIYTITASSYPFRVRLAPENTGVWTFTTELKINNTTVSNCSGSFTVGSSSHKGPLITDGGNTFLKYKNSGDHFFVIGQNTDVPHIDDQIKSNSIYLPNSSERQDFIAVRSAISDLAANDANFVRMRFVPHCNDIEGAFQYNQTLPFRTLDKCLNNYDARQHHAWEFDQTIDALEQNNIYSILTLFYDPSFGYNSGYEFTWQNPIQNQTSWHFNPHSTNSALSNTLVSGVLTNSTYLLPATLTLTASYTDPAQATFSTSIGQFFAANSSSSPIFKKVMNKVYYIMARWGYSPNIAIWQIMNETNNTGLMGSTQYSVNTESFYRKNPFGTSPTFGANEETWITNVNAYLQSMYPQKISSNGYGDDPGYSNQNNNLDIQSFNSYTHNVWHNQDRFTENKSHRDQNKRFMNSEYGFLPEIDWCEDIEAHNAVWSNMFSGGIGTPLYFWDQYEEHGVDHRSKYKSIATFMNLLPSNFLVGKNPVVSYSVIAGSNFTVSSQTVHKAIENYFMYFGTPTYNTEPFGMGWVHNYSSNWYGLQQGGSLSYSSCATPSMVVGTNTFITTISTYTPFHLLPAALNPATNIGSYTYTEKNLYSITGISSPSSTEPKIIISNIYPNYNFEMKFYNTRTGAYVYSTYPTSNSVGTLTVNIDIDWTDFNNTFNSDLAYMLCPFWSGKTKRLGNQLLENDQNSESLSGKDLILFPNPTNGIVSLELLNASFASLEVFNSMGQRLKEIITNGESGIKIDLSGYGENVLMIKVNTKEGQVLMKKCIINN